MLYGSLVIKKETAWVGIKNMSKYSIFNLVFNKRKRKNFFTKKSYGEKFALGIRNPFTGKSKRLTNYKY